LEDKKLSSARISKKKIVAMLMLVIVGAVAFVAAQKTAPVENLESKPYDENYRTLKAPDEATVMAGINVVDGDTDFELGGLGVALAKKYVGAL
jgi:hypothetical protein